MVVEAKCMNDSLWQMMQIRVRRKRIPEKIFRNLNIQVPCRRKKSIEENLDGMVTFKKIKNQTWCGVTSGQYQMETIPVNRVQWFSKHLRILRWQKYLLLDYIILLSHSHKNVKCIPLLIKISKHWVVLGIKCKCSLLGYFIFRIFISSFSFPS